MTAECDVGAHVGLGITHSDNIALAGSGAEQSDDVAEVVSGILFNRSQPRFESSVVYDTQSYFYHDTESANGTFHGLDASGTLDLLVDRWFLDVWGVYDRTLRCFQRRTSRLPISERLET